MSWLQIAGKTAIVTGAASGIGRAVVHELVQAGCRVVAGDADTAGPQAVVARNDDECLDLNYAGTGTTTTTTNVLLPVTCNVTSRAQVQELMRAADDNDTAQHPFS